MKLDKKMMVSVFGLAMAVGVLAADYTVESGATFDLRSLPLTLDDGSVVMNEAGNVITFMPGSTGTLSVVSYPVYETGVTPGFATLWGTQFPSAAEWPTNGMDEAEVLPLFCVYATNGVSDCAEIAEQYNIKADRGFYAYCADWTIPEDEAGFYSFFEHFSTAVVLMIDGKVVLANAVWNSPTCVTDINLAAGRHAVTLILANHGTDQNSLFGHANAQKVPGIVYNRSNANMTFAGYSPINSGENPYPEARHFTNDIENGSAPFTARCPTDWGNGSLVHACLNLHEGNVTLDASNVAPFIYGGLCTTNGGCLTVVGTNALDVGGYVERDMHYTFLSAPVSFAEEDGTSINGTIRFVGSTTIIAAPTDWELASDSGILGLMAPNFPGSDLSLTTWDATILATNAFSADQTVTVGVGRTLQVKPCIIDPASCWKWHGIDTEILLNVKLDGGELKFMNVPDLVVNGNIAGNGTITVDKGSWTPETIFRGTVAVTGELNIVTGNNVVIETDSLGDTVAVNLLEGPHSLDKSAWGTLRLRPEGAGVSETTASIALLTGDEALAKPTMCVYSNQILTLGDLSGSLTIQGDDVSSSRLVVSSSTDMSGVVFKNLAYVTLDALSDGMTVPLVCDSVGLFNLPENVHDLSLAASNDALIGRVPASGLRRVTVASGATVTLPEGTSVAVVSGDGVVRFQGDGRVSIVEGQAIVMSMDGTVTVDSATANAAHDLGSEIDPALWLDASSSASRFRQLTYQGEGQTYTNDAVLIDKWFDARPDHNDLYGWNRRGDDGNNYPQVFPYLLPGTCNGLTTAQFGYFANRVPPDVRENRRIPFNHPITAKYCVMVFGSQNGGGTTMLGGWNCTEYSKGPTYSTPGKLRRFEEQYYTTNKYSSTLQAWARDWSQPIFATSRPTWVNGKPVDPTVTGYNGEYQIISYEIDDGEGNGIAVQSLGGDTDSITSSGQIFGEVLVFTNALTEAQRQRVEEYLSKKWGIALEVTGEGPSVAMATGSSLVVDGDATASGAFTDGTVMLKAGSRLTVPALKLPWREADIPTNNLSGWYDPDDASRCLKRTIANDTRPLAIDSLFSKFSGTTAGTYVQDAPFLSGFLKFSDYDEANADRRPWRAEGTRGVGPSRRWLDYTVMPENDDHGNCLRFKTTFSEWYGLNKTGRVNTPWQTAFMVTDTSAGGGNALCTQYALTPKGIRKGWIASEPIWANNTEVAITGGKTYLDGSQINGTTQGYTGRPELLTVQATNNVNLHAIGFYNGASATSSGETSHEILGEMIFYNDEVGDDVRAEIEAYLMSKWLGKLPKGYVDWRGTTVSGSGTVTTATPMHLPKLADDFAGTVELTGDNYSFGVDGSRVVTNALVFGAGTTLALPEEGTVSVAFAGTPASCVLMTAGSFSGVDIARWTVNVTPATELKKSLRFCDNPDGTKSLWFSFPAGTTIMIR